MSSWLTSNPRMPMANKNTYVGIVLTGGLANRIFQVLAGQRLAEITGKTFVICQDRIEENPHQKEEETQKQLHELFPKLTYTKESTKSSSWVVIREDIWQWFQYQFDTMPKYPGKNIVLHGYWQNEKYFPRSLPTLAISPIPQPYYFIHFRFGDYANTVHELDLKHYYRKAILRIIRQNTDAQFLVFSDEIDKAREYLDSLPYEVPYSISTTVSALDVLKGMASCRGGICANSSLSFLGAYFQHKPRGTVIMPGAWMKNIPARQMAGWYPSWVTVVDLKDDRPPELQDL